MAEKKGFFKRLKKPFFSSDIFTPPHIYLIFQRTVYQIYTD